MSPPGCQLIGWERIPEEVPPAIGLHCSQRRHVHREQEIGERDRRLCVVGFLTCYYVLPRIRLNPLFGHSIFLPLVPPRHTHYLRPRAICKRQSLYTQGSEGTVHLISWLEERVKR